MRPINLRLASGSLSTRNLYFTSEGGFSEGSYTGVLTRTGWGTLLDTTNPDLPVTVADANLVAFSRLDDSGLLNSLCYKLLYHPINPGDVSKICINANINCQNVPDLSLSNDQVDADCTGTFTLMTSPTDWNPYGITYNTRPAISGSDPSITFRMQLPVYSDFMFFITQKQFVFDLSTITSPIIGFAVECAVSSKRGLITFDAEGNGITAWTSKAPVKYPILFREAVLDDTFGNISKLYLPPGTVSAFWGKFASHYVGVPHPSVHDPIWIQGVGANYDSNPQTTLSYIVAVDTAADTISIIIYLNGYPSTFIEAKTMCGGTIYHNV